MNLTTFELKHRLSKGMRKVGDVGFGGFLTSFNVTAVSTVFVTDAVNATDGHRLRIQLAIVAVHRRREYRFRQQQAVRSICYILYVSVVKKKSICNKN